VKLLLDLPNVRVALFEATHENAPWSALVASDLGIASNALGCAMELRSATQIHGDRILEPHEHGDADGFFLEAGQAAVVRHADCFPVAVTDPVKSRAVLLHCGWRGCALHLARKGVQRLLLAGSDPADLMATIGPGIGATDFEVGPEVLAYFPESVHSSTSRGTPSIDLPAFLMQELEDSGLLRSRITCDLRSTLGDLNLHSHRREGSRSGRMATFCTISPKFGVP
jgi:polyphenol oxidase